MHREEGSAALGRVPPEPFDLPAALGEILHVRSEHHRERARHRELGRARRIAEGVDRFGKPRARVGPPRLAHRAQAAHEGRKAAHVGRQLDAVGPRARRTLVAIREGHVIDAAAPSEREHGE
jgi:hypothetical protein